MDQSFQFKDLFILDLANNHQGDLKHAIQIVEEMGRVVAANGVRAALKFQFRELDSFIHPAHRKGSANKHVPRFLSTRLDRKDFEQLARAVRDNGMITMATPFDERSVDMLMDMNLDLIKVASCSALDWPLLEKIATCTKPVVVSTGGVTMNDVADIVSFLDHRRVHSALMYCVALYPTPLDQMDLNHIEVLRNRFPEKTIGFSTHECPDEVGAVQVAIAKGAGLLERHVGLATDKVTLNAYSSTPPQLDAWIKAALRARTVCGNGHRRVPCDAEIQSLNTLKRGVYARGPIAQGQRIGREDIYFAMPLESGQLWSGEWKEGIVATRPIAADGPLTVETVSLPPEPDKTVLFHTIHTLKAMLNEARIALPSEFRCEFSHHYGLKRFAEVGCTIIECINRDYCKKLILQTPGQRHPSHYHKRKEETFHVLSGILHLELEGRRRTLYPGDILTVPQGCWHDFHTETGVIFEEISTTHFNDDSFYEDKAINALGRSGRKTVVNNWGRYQI